MKLHLSRATPSDLPELMALEFSAFAGQDLHDAMLGPDTPAMRARATDRALRTMTSDLADCWLKITDIETGKIVCGSNWKIYPSCMPSTTTTTTTCATGPAGMSVDCGEWLEGEERETAQRVVDDFLERRRGYCQEAHVCMFVLSCPVLTSGVWRASVFGFSDVEPDLADLSLVRSLRSKSSTSSSHLLLVNAMAPAR